MILNNTKLNLNYMVSRINHIACSVASLALREVKVDLLGNAARKKEEDRNQ